MKERFMGSGLVFLGACCFGILSSIVKTAYKNGYSLGEVTGVQNFFGVLILWGLYCGYKLFYRQHKPIKTNVNTKKWQVCLVGIFPGLVGIFYYQCVQLVPASIAIILLMQYLWISIVIDFIIFKNRPTRVQIITVITIVIGSFLAAGFFNQNITLSFKGCMFGFLAAISYTLFIIMSNRVGNQLPKLQKSALMITGSCIITFIIFPPLFLFQLSLDDQLYQWGIALALLGTVLPPFLFSVGMPKIGISLSAILSAVELPIAVTASYFYLRESVYINQWIGVAIILAAIILPNLRYSMRSAKVLH